MTRTRRAFLAGLAPALATLAVAPVALAKPSPQDLVNQVAVANMFCIESATLALKQSASPAIKDYAHRLADDHATIASSLRRIIARRSDIALPDRPDTRHLDLLRDLGALQGGDFDKAYVEAQRGTHHTLALLLEAYARDGEDPELKAFAADAFPRFKALEQKAQELPLSP